MPSISMEERKSLESKAKLFIHSIGASENATSSLVNLFEPVLYRLNAKVEYSEIMEILLRMDKGFEVMDKRFIMMLSFVSLAFLAMPAIITLILKFMQ